MTEKDRFRDNMQAAASNPDSFLASGLITNLEYMRAHDFWIDTVETDWLGEPILGDEQVLDEQLLTALITRPSAERSDLEVAVALARFTHEQFEGYGSNGAEISQEQSLLAMRALKATLSRLSVTSFDPPYRDFKTFYNYWRTNGAYGSYQARREILSKDFEPLHELLDELESRSAVSPLATAISPHRLTGWPHVDEEISELRRHFESATTQQDYSNIGNDCVAVLEALSAAAYDHSVHQPNSDPEPPVASTKKRLDRVVEVELPGSDNAELRKLARATIEIAQAVKHRRATGTRLEAGLAADAAILLANMIRRISD